MTLDLRDLLVREERKVTWEREASRVIWDLQVHKEKLVKEETGDKKVTKVQREILATRVRKESKVYLVYKVLILLVCPPLLLPLLPPLLLPLLPPLPLPLLPLLLLLENVEVQDGGELYSST